MEAATIAAHLATKTIAGLAGMMIDTHTGHATIETTSAPVVQAAVDLATLMLAAAKRDTTHEAHLPRTATTIVAEIAAAHVHEEVVGVVAAGVVTARALEAEMVSTDTYLEVVVEEMPQPQLLLTPLKKITSVMIVAIISVNAMTADPADETTVAIAIEAIGLVTMIAGTVGGTGARGSMSRIVMFLAEEEVAVAVAVVEKTKLARRSETGVGVVIEIEMAVVEMIVIEGGAQGVGRGVGVGVEIGGGD